MKCWLVVGCDCTFTLLYFTTMHHFYLDVLLFPHLYICLFLSSPKKNHVCKIPFRFGSIKFTERKIMCSILAIQYTARNAVVDEIANEKHTKLNVPNDWIIWLELFIHSSRVYCVWTTVLRVWAAFSLVFRAILLLVGFGLFYHRSFIRLRWFGSENNRMLSTFIDLEPLSTQQLKYIHILNEDDGVFFLFHSAVVAIDKKFAFTQPVNCQAHRT